MCQVSVTNLPANYVELSALVRWLQGTPKGTYPVVAVYAGSLAMLNGTTLHATSPQAPAVSIIGRNSRAMMREVSVSLHVYRL